MKKELSVITMAALLLCSFSAKATDYFCSSNFSGRVKITIDENAITALSKGKEFSYAENGRRVNLTNAVIKCRVLEIDKTATYINVFSECTSGKVFKPGSTFHETLVANNHGELGSLSIPFNSGGEGSGGSEGNESVYIGCDKLN